MVEIVASTAPSKAESQRLRRDGIMIISLAKMRPETKVKAVTTAIKTQLSNVPRKVCQMLIDTTDLRYTMTLEEKMNGDEKSMKADLSQMRSTDEKPTSAS